MPGSFSGGAGPATALRKNDGGGSLSSCTTCQYDSELEHNNCDLANFEEPHGRMRGLLKSGYWQLSPDRPDHFRPPNLSIRCD